MALFGRESDADRERATRIREWVHARTPFSLFSVLFGVLSVVDAFTLLIGFAAGVAAIVFAGLGLRDLARRSTLLGRRLCALGIMLGCTGVMLSILMWKIVYPMIGKN